MSTSPKPPSSPNREPASVDQPSSFGDFLLEKRIAVGGMSEVYLATRISGAGPKGPLVIKRLLPSLLEEPQSRGTFATEAGLHAAARHPNVVEVFEAGEVDGEPYLAMEYVAGADAFRLMRRAQTEQRPIPVPVAIYIGRELCQALACVHRQTDEAGQGLAIVHRDVTPSNIYLSDDGDVKLGDFGIARSLARQTRAAGSYVLKGKYAYLAPEQVSGEPFDHRADLFSLVVVLSEMLINQSLFPGAGQLAVLLAIRDCRIDPLRAAAAKLPKGLFSILDHGLARSPENRFSSAEELYEALTPFEVPNRNALRHELSQWVTWARDSSMLARRIEGVLRESTKIPAYRSFLTPPPSKVVDHDTSPPPSPMLSEVRTRSGTTMKGVPFAKLIELVVTGQLAGEDQVDMMNRGLVRLDSIEVLARHLPPSTATTSRVEGPGVPDYAAELAVTPLLEIFQWLLARRESGALFADRSHEGRGVRKELYFEKGKLTLVASSEPSELLGEYLVAKGAIARHELELALVALPKYDGRLGDTLIGLGLVDPVEVFRAIQNQGRSRVSEMFRWPSGRVTFYRGVAPQRNNFRLDLDIPELMLGGIEELEPGDKPLQTYAHQLDAFFIPVRPPPSHAMAVSWPPSVLTVLGMLGGGRRLSDVLGAVAARNIRAADAIRAMQVAMAGGIVTRRVPT